MLSLYRRGAPLHRASAPLFDPLRHGLVVTSSVGELRTRVPKPAAVSTRGTARGAQLARAGNSGISVHSISRELADEELNGCA
jgi:hypothetical protein